MTLPRRILEHRYTVITAIALTAMGIVAVLKHSSEWDDVYYGSGRFLLDGRDFYRDLIGYLYPPFDAWATIPFAFLPLRLSRAVWYVACALCLIYVMKTSWRMAGGPPVEPHGVTPAAGWRDQLAFLLGHACALQLTLNALTHLQPDLLIAALLMAGCADLSRGRTWRAASWIGVSAAFKVTPLLFAPYLAWRGKWGAAAWLMILAISVNFLPDLVHRTPAGGTWVGEWSHMVLTPMTRSDYLPGDWKNKLNNNQSLAGGVNRWLTTTWQFDKREVDVVTRPNASSTAVVRAAFAALAIVVLLPIAWVMWPPGRRREGVSKAGAPDPPPNWLAVECGIVMLLMLLLSPNSSRSHFCILYLPAFCVARAAVRSDGGKLIRVLLALAIVSATLSMHLRLPGTTATEQVLLWVGVVMFAALFLLFASAAELNQYKCPPIGSSK